jgi:hypothetical protein
MPKPRTITLEIKCTSCRQNAVHEVTYSSEPIHHLRCRECRVVSVYVFEESEETGKTYARVEAVLQDHAAVMQHRGSKDLVAYDTQGSYAHGQYITHSKYGEGYVLDVFGPPMKMSVLFADRIRLHVCGSDSTSSTVLPRARNRSKPAKPKQLEKAPRTPPTKA